MAAEKAFLCVLFEEFSEPDEVGINTCLILQNTLDVTVTALAIQNKREHSNRVKGFVETVAPNYCDPTFAFMFMKVYESITPQYNSKIYKYSIFMLHKSVSSTLRKGYGPGDIAITK